MTLDTQSLHGYAQVMELSAVMSPRGVSCLLQVLLAEHAGPVTPLLARLSGLRLAMDTKEAGWDDGGCWTRTGQMTADGLIVAATWLRLLPGPATAPAVLARLEDGVPAGVALPGLRRVLRSAVTVHGVPGYEGTAVTSKADLQVRDADAGRAREQYTEAFAAHLARVLSS